jgi:CRP/FNR family cyclic AMP-dependent transcriptional regulator
MLTTADKQASLRACPLFAGLPNDALGVLAEALTVEAFGAAEDVCVHGEVADCIYVIHQGSLAVFLPGAATAVRTLAAGDLLGEYGMFTGRRTTTVRALEASTLLSLDHARFRAFLFQVPLAMHRLLELTVRRLQEAEQRLHP